MPVKRRAPKERREGISPIAWAMLHDEPLPVFAKGSKEAWEVFVLRMQGEALPTGRPTLRGLWKAHGAEVTADWAQNHPGTRPSCWWRWEAPEPRQRVGGIGTPQHDVLSVAPEYRLGIPSRWMTQRDVAAFRLTAAAFAICISNPPRYEGQASYLERHTLLLPGERERVPESEFRPVAVTSHG